MTYYYHPDVAFSELKGLTIASIEGAEKGSDEIKIRTTDGREFAMYHSQDCCESVSVEDVVGDVKDLIGYTILEAEEVVNPDDAPKNDYYESYTWTFYKIGTIKGRVTIRWFGGSNGYYGESVSFVELTKSTRV